MFVCLQTPGTPLIHHTRYLSFSPLPRISTLRRSNVQGIYFFLPYLAFLPWEDPSYKVFIFFSPTSHFHPGKIHHTRYLCFSPSPRIFTLRRSIIQAIYLFLPYLAFHHPPTPLGRRALIFLTLPLPTLGSEQLKFHSHLPPFISGCCQHQANSLILLLFFQPALSKSSQPLSETAQANAVSPSALRG
jgi:hypothetical protein